MMSNPTGDALALGADPTKPLPEVEREAAVPGRVSISWDTAEALCAAMAGGISVSCKVAQNALRELIEAGERAERNDATPAALGALRKLSEVATPGEWRADIFSDGIAGNPESDGWDHVAATPNPRSPYGSAHHRQWQANAAFISAAVNYVRAALSRAGERT